MDRLGALLLGATTALLFTVLPRGVLWPAVDRTLPWTTGLLAQALLFGVGLACAPAIGRNRRRLLFVAVACFAGGLVAAELADWARPALVRWLLSSLPFHPLVALTCGAVALPLAVPLGALAGQPLRAGGRSTTWWLGGAALGFATGPILCELLLGWSVSLRAVGLLGAAGGTCLFSDLPRPTGRVRLAPGAGAGLALVGAAVLGCHLQMRDALGLGGLAGPWWAASLALGAALAGLGTPRARLHPSLLAVAWVLLLPLLDPLSGAVRADTSADPRAGVVTLLLLGLPAGLLAGGLLARREDRGLPLRWVPAALVILTPAVLWWWLPLWGPRGTSWALAAVGLVAAWAARTLQRPGTREHLAAIAVLALVSVLGLGRPAPADALPAAASWPTAEGPVAVVHDPASGTERLAPGRLADLGVSPAQRRRMLHIPLLLHRLEGVLPQDHVADGSEDAGPGVDALPGDARRGAPGRAAPGGKGGKGGKGGEAEDAAAATAREIPRGDAVPRTLLLSASSHGEEARAALQHDLESIVWVEPVADRTAVVDTTADGAAATTYLSRTDHGERLLLLGRDDLYDAIILAPDPLARRRASRLGTVEFYQAARLRLAPGGVFCQWWDLFSVDVSDVKAMLAGAAQAFEHVYLVLDHPRSRRAAVGIVGSSWPLAVDLERLEQYLLQHPGVQRDLEAVGLDGMMIAGLVMADRGMLELLAPDVDALTDARPTLDVRAPLRRLIGGFHPEEIHATLTLRRRNPMPWIRVFHDVDTGPGGPADESPARAEHRARVRERVDDILQGWQQLIGGAGAVVAQLGTDVPAFELEAPGAGPEVEAEAFLAALPRLHDWPYLDGLVLGHADRLQREGRAHDAERWLRRAVAAKDWSAPFRYALAEAVERKGDLDDAAILYRTVLAFDADHAGAQSALQRLGGG